MGHTAPRRWRRKSRPRSAVAKCIHDGKHGAKQKGKENKNYGAARAQQQIAAESKRVNYSPTAVVQVVQAFERRAQALRCDDSNKDEDGNNDE